MQRGAAMRAHLRKLLKKWRHERLVRKAVRRGIEAAGHPDADPEGPPSRAPEAPPGGDKPG
jgi:hypothetical protein